MAIAGRNIDGINLRVPPGLRSRIQGFATKNSRSMNSEVVATLEAAYPVPVEPEGVNQRLRQAAQNVADTFSTMLIASGQSPSDNAMFRALCDALDAADDASEGARDA